MRHKRDEAENGQFEPLFLVDLAERRYVSKIKLMATGMLRGLQFLAESETDRQWVHHDLKPENMVYSEEEDSVALVDFGTTISSLEPNKTQDCTLLYRPPEVGNMNFWGRVGWKPPIWSFDIFSAGVILGAAGAVSPHSPRSSFFPSVSFLNIHLTPSTAAKMSTLKAAARCARQGEWKDCLMQAVKIVAQDVFSERVRQVLEWPKQSDARKAAMASLLVCLPKMESPDDPSTGWVQKALSGSFESKAPSYLWSLLDDWMRTGFDEILLQMLDGNPNRRPKPSAVLAAEWFKTDAADLPGRPVEFTCPSIPESEIGVLYRHSSRGVWLALFTGLLLCSMGLSKMLVSWIMRLAGLMTLAVPLIFFYAMESPYMWASSMCTMGVIMTSAPSLPLQDSHRQLILGIASFLLALRAIAHLLTLRLLLSASGDQVAKAALVAIGADVMVCCMLLIGILVAVGCLRRSTGTEAAENSNEIELRRVSTP